MQGSAILHLAYIIDYSSKFSFTNIKILEMPLIEFENFVDIGISIGINYSVNYSDDYSVNIILMIILLMLFY